MSDLIRRDDAMQAIADYEFPWCEDSEPVHLVYGMGTAMKIVEKIPTADAVEVVRCWGCKYWGTPTENQEAICRHWSSYYGSIRTKNDQYCSYGERSGEKE